VLVKLAAMTHAVVPPAEYLDLRSRSSAVRIGPLQSPSKNCFSITFAYTTPVTSKISCVRKVAEKEEKPLELYLTFSVFFSIFLDPVL
jgi:hypothetical protein